MDRLAAMQNMLNRVKFLDELNANTQRRLESGRKTQVLSDIAKMEGAALTATGREKLRIQEGIDALKEDLLKHRSIASQTTAPSARKERIDRTTFIDHTGKRVRKHDDDVETKPNKVPKAKKRDAISESSTSSMRGPTISDCFSRALQ